MSSFQPSFYDGSDPVNSKFEMLKQALRHLSRLLRSWVIISCEFNDDAQPRGHSVSTQDPAAVPSPSGVMHSRDVLTPVDEDTHTHTPFCSVPTTNEVWPVPSSSQEDTVLQAEAAMKTHTDVRFQ